MLTALGRMRKHLHAASMRAHVGTFRSCAIILRWCDSVCVTVVRASRMSLSEQCGKYSANLLQYKAAFILTCGTASFVLSGSASAPMYSFRGSGWVRYMHM